METKRWSEDSCYNYKDSKSRSDAELYSGGIGNPQGKEKEAKEDSGIDETGIDPREGGENGLEGGGVTGGIYEHVYGNMERAGHGVPGDYMKDSVFLGQVMLGLADSRACSSFTTCLCRF